MTRDHSATSERGASTTEWLMIAGVTVLTLITVLGVFGDRMGSATSTIARCINSAVRGQFAACGGASNGSNGAVVRSDGPAPINSATGLPQAAMSAAAAGASGGGGRGARAAAQAFVSRGSTLPPSDAAVSSAASPGSSGIGGQPNALGSSGAAGVPGGASALGAYLPSGGASAGAAANGASPNGNATNGLALQNNLTRGGGLDPKADQLRQQIRGVLQLQTQQAGPTGATDVLTDAFNHAVGNDDTLQRKGEELGNKALNNGFNHVRQANALLQRGDTAGAEVEIRQARVQFNRANQFLSIAESQNANLAQQAMNQAVYVHDQATNVQSVLTNFAPPAVGSAFTNLSRATTFAVTGETEGYGAATKNLATDLAASAVIGKITDKVGDRVSKAIAARNARLAGQELRQALTNPATIKEAETTAVAVAAQVKTAMGEAGHAAGGIGSAEARGAAQQLAGAEGKALAQAEAGAAGQLAHAEGSAATRAAEGEGRLAAARANVGAGTTHGPPVGLTPQQVAERAEAIEAGGILPAHANAINAVSTARDEIVISRPVSKFAGPRLEGKTHSGEFPATKPLILKSKSADDQLVPGLAGWIPVNAGLSKTGSRQAALRQETKALEQQLAGGGLSAEARAAADTRMRDLRQQMHDLHNEITHQNQVNSRALSLPEGDPNKLYAARDPVSGHRIFVTKDGRPITADYDLLPIGGKTIDPQKPAATGVLGYTTARSRAATDDINRAINHPGGNMVQHGLEQGRNLVKPDGTMMKPNIDFPMTAFHPNGTVTSIKDMNQLKNYFNEQSRNGYHLEPNPGWGWHGKPDEYK